MQTNEVISTISSIILRCEKMLPKFQEGTSQHTLLCNRIQAMYIAKALLEECAQDYTIEDMKKAVLPVESILHKCEKAQSKYEIDTKQYRRYCDMIEAMRAAKVCIEQKLNSL